MLAPRSSISPAEVPSQASSSPPSSTTRARTPGTMRPVRAIGDVLLGRGVRGWAGEGEQGTGLGHAPALGEAASVVRCEAIGERRGQRRPAGDGEPEAGAVHAVLDA